MGKKGNIFLLVVFIVLGANITKAQNPSIAKQSELGFIENRGQVHDQNYQPNALVKYLFTSNKGLNVQLKQTGFSYDTYVVERTSGANSTSLKGKESAEETIKFHRIDIELIGANPHAEIFAEEPLMCSLNFYTTGTSEKGITDLRKYKKVTYKEIYPGIDLEFYANQSEYKPVEYNFIVKDSGNINQIQLKYTGESGYKIGKDKIKIQTAYGTISEVIPSSWIKETGKRQSVEYRAIEKKENEFIVGLNTNATRKKGETLIVDPAPILEYASYYGGTGSEQFIGISINPLNDDMYIAGRTNSSGMATSGVYQSNITGGYDAMVSKFDQHGVLIWTTYMGGSAEDIAIRIAYDMSGGVSIIGHTKSTDYIATTGALETTNNGSGSGKYGIFVARFNNTDGTRNWSTYYGYNTLAWDWTRDHPDIASSLTAIYITAGSASDPAIVAGASPLQGTCGGNQDMVVAKFDFNGVIQWGTYYGGSDYDEGGGIAIDLLENVYVTGFSKNDGLGTSGVFQEHYATHSATEYPQNIILLKLNSNGARQWCTYFGTNKGTWLDGGLGVACTSDNSKVYIIGSTSIDSSYMTTSGAYQSTYPSGVSGTSLLACFNPATGNRLWSTYVGGDSYTSRVTTTCNNDPVVSLTSSTAGLASANAYQSVYGGSQDLFIARFNGDGALQWSTYYGGTGSQRALDLKINSKLRICVVGRSGSSIPSLITPDAYQVNNAGGDETILVKFSEANIAGTKTVCQGTTLSLNAEFSTTATPVTYAWSGPNGVTGSTATLDIPDVQLAHAGIYSLTVTANGCSYVKTDSIKVNPAPIPTASVVSPICVGDSVKLTSSGGVSYSWSGPNGFASVDQNPVLETSVLASGGVYTVIATNSLGCTATATATLVVNARPATTATSNSPICENGTISLSSGPDSQTSYAWSGPLSYTSTAQNPSIANSPISRSGAYMVTVTNSYGCTASAQTTVVVNSNPIATALSNSPVCENGTINLTSGPDAQTSYIWSGPISYTSSSQNPAIINATTNMTGNYSVIVSNSYGCKDTAVVAVVVNPNPIAVASSNSPVCENDTVFLTSAPNSQTSYVWSGPSAYNANIQNPQIINSTTAQSGTYTVTVTNSFGCTATAQTSVTVNSRPVVTASCNSPICEGDTLRLKSTGGTNCNWTGIAGFTSADPNPVITNTTPSMSGLYTVVITNGFGCTKSAQTNSVINPKPDITISSSPAICSGYPLNLHAGGGSGYQWTGPNGYNSVDQNPVINPVTAIDSGLYTVIVTNVFTCKDTAEINVVVHDNPIPAIASNSPICAYDSIRLTSGGGASYSWAGANAFTSNIQNPIIHTSDTTFSGTYTVVVTNVYGCTASASTTVEVKSNPKPLLSSNAPICAGDSLKLFSSSGQSYQWNGPLGYTNSLQTPVLIDATFPMNGYYSQSIKYSNGCQNNDSIAVIIWSNPVLSITSDTAICLYQPITVSVSGADTYTWNNGSTASSYLIYPAVDTVYRVVGTDTNGCVSTDSVQVLIHPFIQVSITQKPEGTLFKSQVATYTAVPSGYENYSFYLNNVLVQSSSSNVYTSSTLSDNDTLQVIVSHPGMCFSEQELGIQVIDIYNSFSPNNDGVNDLFLKGYQITIFNRWGDVLYEGVDGWDGKYKGEDVNTGTYYFTIKYYSSDNTEINYKGNLMLVR